MVTKIAHAVTFFAVHFTIVWQLRKQKKRDSLVDFLVFYSLNYSLLAIRSFWAEKPLGASFAPGTFNSGRASAHQGLSAVEPCSHATGKTVHMLKALAL